MTTSTPRIDRRGPLARAGEELAARHLMSLGMTVLARNWRCPQGEVDLVLRDGDDLVICEVKTRRSLAYGDPLEAITRPKLARLRQLAAVCAKEMDLRAEVLRIDAVGVLWPLAGVPTLRHIRGVLS
jgi:putative endonuclease